MRRVTAVWIALCTIVLLGAAAIAEGPKNSKSSASPKTAAAQAVDETYKTYVQVALWDVAPEKAKAFEAAVREQLSRLPSTADVINARVLKSLSELNSQYATYVRYANVMTAEDSLAKQIAVLGHLCTRPPETHLIGLERAYSPAGVSQVPTGSEFAIGGTGQVAHLGLWVADPRLIDNYETTLQDIKVGTMKQQNPGFIGEDLGNEVRLLSPEAQTPYSPHPKFAAPMMINYGEFKTFQSAEEAFMEHQNDPNNEAQMQTFFGSLQVPTRFFIYKVVQSYNYSEHALGHTPKTSINEANAGTRK
jgi:hypothetical protein